MLFVHARKDKKSGFATFRFLSRHIYEAESVNEFAVEARKYGFVPSWHYELVVKLKDGKKEVIKIFANDADALKIRSAVEALLMRNEIH